MTEQLIQTRVPQRVGEWVAKAAEAEGVSVAAWLRRAVLAVVGGLRVDAWLVKLGEDPSRYHRDPPNPHMTLQLLSRVGATHVFTILHPPTHSHAGEPWSELRLKESDLFTSQSERGLLLRGSPERWRIVSTLFDAVAQRVELAVEVAFAWRCEHSGASDVLDLGGDPPARVQWCMECGSERHQVRDDDEEIVWTEWDRPAFLERLQCAGAAR